MAGMAAARGSASASSITLGSNNATAATFCTQGISWVQRKTAPSSPSYRAPSNGKIISWTTSGGPSPWTARLKIWRPTSHPSVFTPVAESLVRTVPAGNKLTTFPTSILVHKGDVIGIASISGAECIYFAPRAKPGDVAAYVPGNPTSGAQTFTDCRAQGCVSSTGASRLNLSVRFRATT
jgi:hypothetical protein